jgi:hypothetical protein
MLHRALVAAAFLAVVLWRQDLASFGYFHDDTLYFASAQALATGRGYAIPSIPGNPPQTKYPVLYPLLLSAVWKISPRFPDNLSLALGLTALFGAALVAGWHALLLELGASRRVALVLTAASAFHPFVLALSGALLSDIPFMALAVWAAVLAKVGRPPWAAAGPLTGLAVLARSMGLAVVAGILAALLLRRLWRQAGLYAAVCAPFVVASLWSRPPAIEGLDGYRQTLLFYTSYTWFWKLSIPDFRALLALVGSNALEILKAPAALCLPLPQLPENAYVQGVVVLLLSAAILIGVARLGRHPIQFILVFYAAITLLWNYPLANRFLLLFLPVFWWGAVRLALALPRRRVVMVVAAFLLVESAYANLWLLPNQLAAAASERASLAREKQEAYAWIQSRTAAADRFIAYEDVSLYLHTARQALRPLALTSPPKPERDLSKLADTARQIRARYWLVAADDYQLEEAAAALQEHTQRLLRPFPVVFRSRGGRVMIYEVKAE